MYQSNTFTLGFLGLVSSQVRCACWVKNKVTFTQLKFWKPPTFKWHGSLWTAPFPSTTHMTAIRDYSVHIPTLLSTLYYAQLFILSAYTYSNTYSKSFRLAWLGLRSCQLVRQANYKAGGNVWYCGTNGVVPVGLSSPLYSVHWLSIVLYYNLVASPKQNASQHAIYTIAIVQSTMPEYSVVGFQV